MDTKKGGEKCSARGHHQWAPHNLPARHPPFGLSRAAGEEKIDDDARKPRLAASTTAMSSMRGQCRGPLLGSSEGLALPCSHVIGSGFLTSECSSTSSIRETGRILSAPLTLSEISMRSFAFSSGISTVLIPPRRAASSFSLRRSAIPGRAG